MNFREAFYTLLPSWLTQEEGEKVAFSLAAVKDAFVQRTREGLLARFPQYGPADAFEFHGRDRKIIRGLNESDETYAARLLRWLDDHPNRGGPYALLEQVGAFWDNAFASGPLDLYLIFRNGRTFHRDPTTKEITYTNITWDYDSLPGKWARWWLVIYWPDGSIGADGLWSDPGTWDDGGVWDSNLDGETVERLRRVPRAWNAAHCTNGNGKIILLGGDPPPELWDFPAGTWDDPGVWGVDSPPVVTIGLGD